MKNYNKTDISVPFFDLALQYKQFANEAESAILEILRTQKFILGKYVSELEFELAKLCETKYAVAVSSGTDAILAALMAINIKSGDEILLPDFTFFATAGAIARLGAIPVFVDISPGTFNIDTNAIRLKITPKTKAIIPVHLYGQGANMLELHKIATEHNIPIIEDACQAIGTSLADGKMAGGSGLMGCFSFYPTKNLGGAGDGGAITTNDENIYNKLKHLRNHGMEPRYYHSFVGGNFRMDEIQAAFLVKKLPFLQKWNSARIANAELYSELFVNVGLTNENATELSKNVNIIIPAGLLVSQKEKQIFNLKSEQAENTLLDFKAKNSAQAKNHTFHQYVVRCNKRDELKQFLAEQRVGTDIYYPVPLHKQQCFSYLRCDDNSFQNTNKACEEVLALPIFPELKVEQVKYVVQQIAEFYS